MPTRFSTITRLKSVAHLADTGLVVGNLWSIRLPDKHTYGSQSRQVRHARDNNSPPSAELDLVLLQAEIGACYVRPRALERGSLLWQIERRHLDFSG